MISKHHLYDILLFVIRALFWVVEVNKDGFLFEVDILKVGKIENCSRDHFPIALSWASTVRISQRNISHCENKPRKKMCNFVFFFLQINYVSGSSRSIERIKLNDRLNKDIRLQPLCENTFSSLIYTRNLIELLKNFLFSYFLHVTLRKSLDGS